MNEDLTKIKSVRRSLWLSSAVMFGIWILDALFIQKFASSTIPLLMFIFGATLIVDSFISFREREFVYYFYTIRGAMAQIGAVVIFIVGFFLFISGVSGLLSLIA